MRLKRSGVIRKRRGRKLRTVRRPIVSVSVSRSRKRRVQSTFRRRTRAKIARRGPGPMPVDVYELPTPQFLAGLSSEPLPWIEKFEKIFVISIRPLRLRGLRMSLKDWWNHVQQVAAVNGHYLTLANVPNLAPGAGLSRGQVGCYLSHINAWKEITSQGLECALVLEDDAAICYKRSLLDKMTQCLQELEEGAIEWDIFNLGYWAPHFAQFRNITAHVGVGDCWTGTQAYAVTKRGVQILLDHIGQMHLPVDIAIGELTKQGVLKSVCTVPPLFSYVRCSSDTTHL